MSKRIEIPLIGGHYKSKQLVVDAQECINLYAVIDKSGGKFASFNPVPGLKEWVDTGISKEVRGEYVFGIYNYVLVGNTVLKFDANKNFITLSATLDNDFGPVKFVDNGTQIMIGDLTDGKGYVIELDVLTKITIPIISSLTEQDGYAIISEKGTKRFYISTLDTASLAAYDASDFTRWSVLEFEIVGSLKGSLSAIISDHDELWAMGSEQVGFYYNSQNADFPFTKTQHPFQEVGLGGSPSCIVQLDNSLFWLDAWNNVRKADGYTPIIVSTPELSSQWEEYSKISDSFAFGHRYAGHSFYCLTFPDADKTYCYDVSTGLWALRSTGLNDGRWRANCYARFNRKHLFGDYKNGKIYELDADIFTDDGEVFRATRTTKYTDTQRRRVFYHRLELEMKTGVGNVLAPGDDPKIMLQWSDDGGENWSNEKWAKLGKIGKTTTRVIWRKLGRSRDRIFRFRITDPVNRVLIALYADITLGYE